MGGFGEADCPQFPQFPRLSCCKGPVNDRAFFATSARPFLLDAARVSCDNGDVFTKQAHERVQECN